MGEDDPFTKAMNDAALHGVGVVFVNPDAAAEHIPVEEFRAQRDPVQEAVERGLGMCWCEWREGLCGKHEDCAHQNAIRQVLAAALAPYGGLEAIKKLEATLGDRKMTDEPISMDDCGDDARKWASAFRRTALRLGYSDMDEGWLIGWFANAIEQSHGLRIGRSAAVLDDGSAVFVATVSSGAGDDPA